MGKDRSSCLAQMKRPSHATPEFQEPFRAGGQPPRRLNVQVKRHRGRLGQDRTLGEGHRRVRPHAFHIADEPLLLSNLTQVQGHGPAICPQRIFPQPKVSSAHAPSQFRLRGPNSLVQRVQEGRVCGTVVDHSRTLKGGRHAHHHRGACRQGPRFVLVGAQGRLKRIVPNALSGARRPLEAKNQHQDCAETSPHASACSVWARASSAAVIQASSSKWFHRWGSAITCSMTRC